MVISYIHCYVVLFIMSVNHIETKRKHISDLKIGDDVVILIPTVMNCVGKVTFINLEKQFIFLDGDIDDEEEYGIPFIPDSNGCFRVPI